MCIGVGAAECEDLLHLTLAKGDYSGSSSADNYGEEHSSSAVLTFAFEYSTSDDPSKAGNSSDMFLTPSLNIKFSESANISFDTAACSGASKTIYTWSLDSPSNVPVCLLLACLLFRIYSLSIVFG